MRTNSASARIAKGTLLVRVAAELHDLSAQTAQIEDVLASHIADAPAPDGESRLIIQELDRMRQTQACLAACLEVIADMDPADREMPEAMLLGRLPLPSVAERLRTGERFADARPGSLEPELW